MADMTGIRVRHGKDCRTNHDAGARCNCAPTFEASVTVPRSRKKIRESFPSAAAARSWRIDALGAVKRGTLREPTSTTLREAAETYFEGMRSGAIRDRRGEVYKPSAIRGYEQSLNSRGHAKMASETNARGHKVTRRVFARTSILDDLGARKLSAIERRDIQGVVERMLAAGCDGSTIRNALKPLQVIFRRAIERDEVVVNPTVGIKLPAIKEKPMRVAEPVESFALLNAIRVEDRALWAVAFYAGLRLGEMQALDISALDFAEGEIVVARSYDYKARTFGETKSRKTRRVPMCAALRSELLAHLSRKMASGTRHGLVFGRTPELPFVGNSVARRAATDWKKKNLRPIGFHECRHTYVSTMHAAGCALETIGDYVGHSGTYMTNHYRHLLDGQRAEDVKRFDAYLASATS